jgi:hypothetical protein
MHRVYLISDDKAESISVSSHWHCPLLHSYEWQCKLSMQGPACALRRCSSRGGEAKNGVLPMLQSACVGPQKKGPNRGPVARLFRITQACN